jgi:hypothetical protein
VHLLLCALDRTKSSQYSLMQLKRVQQKIDKQQAELGKKAPTT